MNLTIDVGNTHISGGLFEDDKIVLQFRKHTSPNLSSDEIGIFLRDVLRENDFDWKNIQKICCCSVVPSINHSLANACIKYFNKEPLFIQAGIKTGLNLKISNPKEIGADLLASAVGATTLYPDQNLIIVDMGSATTIAAVSRNKEYLGGAILPGLKLSAQALANGTANLTAVEITRPEKIIRNSTTEAIQTGLFYGTLGAVKELIRRYQSYFTDGQAKVIGTGGFAKMYDADHLFNTFYPELTLFGLNQTIKLN